MKSCPLCSLVGDNCDIKVRPRHVSLEHQVRDCHFFGMLLVFSRLANVIQGLTNEPPALTQAEHLNPNNFVLNDGEIQALLQSYKVMVGRLMSKHFSAFRWLKDVLPLHIPHQYQDQMAKQSSVIPVKLILRNEAKYEDCVWILHEARQLLNECFEGMLILVVIQEILVWCVCGSSPTPPPHPNPTPPPTLPFVFVVVVPFKLDSKIALLI
mgnify:CR=1 FL=1